MGALFLIFVILTVFVGAPILIITLVVSNTKRRNQNAAPVPQPVYTQPVQPNYPPQNSNNNYRQQPQQTDMVQELGKYKNLLDSGLINEEEYEQMKKKILGL